MDRIIGVLFAEAVRRNPPALAEHLEQMITLHRSVHRHEAISLGGLRQRLAANIQAAPGRQASDSRRLLALLHDTPDGDRLCSRGGAIDGRVKPGLDGGNSPQRFQMTGAEAENGGGGRKHCPHISMSRGRNKGTGTSPSGLLG